MLILALTFCLASASTASAESLYHRDQRHDVVTFDNDGNAIHMGHTPDPDVVRTKLAHGTDWIMIRLTFANLHRDQHDRTTYGRITTPNNGYGFRSIVNASQGSETLSLRSHSTLVDCPDLKQTVSYSADRLKLQVPRTCLGTPRWVRIGVITGLDRPHTAGWWDDGLRDGTNYAFTAKMSEKLSREP